MVSAAIGGASHQHPDLQCAPDLKVGTPELSLEEKPVLFQEGDSMQVSVISVNLMKKSLFQGSHYCSRAGTYIMQWRVPDTAGGHSSTFDFGSHKCKFIYYYEILNSENFRYYIHNGYHHPILVSEDPLLRSSLAVPPPSVRLLLRPLRPQELPEICDPFPSSCDRFSPLHADSFQMPFPCSFAVRFKSFYMFIRCNLTYSSPYSLMFRIPITFRLNFYLQQHVFINLVWNNRFSTQFPKWFCVFKLSAVLYRPPRGAKEQWFSHPTQT